MVLANVDNSKLLREFLWFRNKKCNKKESRRIKSNNGLFACNGDRIIGTIWTKKVHTMKTIYKKVNVKTNKNVIKNIT